MELSQKNLKKLTLVAFAAILFNWAVQHIATVGGAVAGLLGLLMPFLLGCAIAFILNVPMKKIERRLFPKSKNAKLQRVRRPLAFFLSLLLVLLILAFALFVIIPGISDTVHQIALQAPAAIRAAQNWVSQFMVYLPQLDELQDMLAIDWDALVRKAGSLLQNWGGSLLNSGATIVGGIISATASFFIGFVFAIYLLMQKEKLARQSKQLLLATLPQRIADRVIYIARLSNQTFSSFLSGQCIEAVILGSLFVIAMSILRIPYALLIGVLISLCALVPIVGAFLGCFLGSLLILMVSPIKALEFVILFLVLQQIEGNLIYPQVVGSSVGLPSIWVLVAVTLGGKLMGVTGMLLFIPLCSVCYALLRDFTHQRLRLREIPPEKWETSPTPPESKSKSAQ
ncbi:MAG: AI-2E family transporter [Oscillospiraceae bacterium]